MTADEFYNEFNLAYNNLASNQAPGLDKYEISVYLTKAQTALVDALYGKFEKSEEARRKLVNVVKTCKCTAITVTDTNKLYYNDTDVFVNTFSLPNDLRYIVNEQVKMKDDIANECMRDKFLKVQPISHDEINTIVENPFRFNERRALRLDTSYTNNADIPYVELLTKINGIDYYKIRYIKNPDPIILDIFDETIDGKVNTSGVTYLGSLPATTHRQIVEIAAKMAYADYKS